MEDRWKIELYENARGEKPVEEFFDSLNKKVNLKMPMLLNYWKHLA